MQAPLLPNAFATPDAPTCNITFLPMTIHCKLDNAELYILSVGGNLRVEVMGGFVRRVVPSTNIVGAITALEPKWHDVASSCAHFHQNNWPYHPLLLCMCACGNPVDQTLLAHLHNMCKNYEPNPHFDQMVAMATNSTMTLAELMATVARILQKPEEPTVPCTIVAVASPGDTPHPTTQQQPCKKTRANRNYVYIRRTRCH